MRRLYYESNEPPRPRIAVEYDPDSLVDSWAQHPEIDRDATLREYGLSLSRHLSDAFNAVGVAVTPVPGLPSTRVTIEPETAGVETEQLRAAILAAIQQHWEAGGFWVERDAGDQPPVTDEHVTAAGVWNDMSPEAAQAALEHVDAVGETWFRRMAPDVEHILSAAAVLASKRAAGEQVTPEDVRDAIG